MYFPEKQWSDSDQLQLFTDSAGGSQLGCAAILGSCWSFIRWSSVWSDSAILKDITFLELVPIVLAFHLWGGGGGLLQNKKIVLRSDNQALIFILNKKSSKPRRVMHILRPLVLKGILHNIHFKASHVDGISNCIADSAILKYITFLELVPIVLAFHLWGRALLQNKKIVLRSDNQALIFILNKKSSKPRRVMHSLRPLVLKGMLHNIHFKASHVDGISNCIADSVSRQE